MIRKKVSKILISAGVVASVIGISPVILSHAQTLNNEHNYKIDSSNSSIQKAVVNTTVKLSNGTANKYDMAVITGENGNNYNIITQYGVTGSIPKSYLTIVKSGTGNKLIKLNETEHVIHVTTVLNVREQPDVHSGLLTTLKEDTNIQVTGQEGEWLQVNINGQIGYVYNDFVGQGTIGNVTSAQATNNIINQEIQQQGKKAYKEALNNIKTINNYENNEANMQNENTNTKTNIITNTTRPYQTTITYSTPKNGYVNIANGYLNLRNGAGLENPVIDHLLKNEKIEVLAKNGNWYEISVNNKTGWVYSKYITLGKINSPIKNTSFQNPQVNTPHKYEPKQSAPNNKTNVKPVVPEHHQDVKPSVKPEQPQQPTKPAVKPVQQQVTKTVLEVETLCNGKEVKGATYCILGTGKYEGQNFTTNGKEMVLTLDSADVTGANLTVLPNGYGFVNYTTNKVVSVKDGVRTIKVVTELKVDKANEPQSGQSNNPQGGKAEHGQSQSGAPSHKTDVKPVQPQQPEHKTDVKPVVTMVPVTTEIVSNNGTVLVPSKTVEVAKGNPLDLSYIPQIPQGYHITKITVNGINETNGVHGDIDGATKIVVTVTPNESVKPVVPEHHQDVKPSVKPEQPQQPTKPTVKPVQQQVTKTVLEVETLCNGKEVKGATYCILGTGKYEGQNFTTNGKEMILTLDSADVTGANLTILPNGYGFINYTTNKVVSVKDGVRTIKVVTELKVDKANEPQSGQGNNQSQGGKPEHGQSQSGAPSHKTDVKPVQPQQPEHHQDVKPVVPEHHQDVKPVQPEHHQDVQQGMAINSQEFNQIFANEVCSEVNAIRAQHGLSQLQEVSIDNTLAQDKAKDMDITGLSHSDSPSFQNIINNTSNPEARGLLFNLGSLGANGSTGTAAYAKQLAKEAVNLWMSSAAHAAAILSSGFNNQGAGIHYYTNAEGTPCVWVVWGHSGINTSQINWN